MSSRLGAQAEQGGWRGKAQQDARRFPPVTWALMVTYAMP
jgi:hypothetical protein